MPILRKGELTRSLSTSDRVAAKIGSRKLYIASETLFEALRAFPMLSEAQIKRLVSEFYSTVVEKENELRLNGHPLTDKLRQQRIQHYAGLASSTKKALARNDFENAKFVTEAMLRKHRLAGTLTRAEVNQARQAILRAGIDLAEHLKARYQGNFNHEPKDELLKKHLRNFDGFADAKSPAQGRPKTAARFSELSKKFLNEQIATKAWEKQTALQARKSFDLFVEINGDLPLSEYTREHSSRFRELIQQLPADYGKAAAYRGLSVSAILAKREGQSDPERHAEISQKTIKRHFSALSGLWGAQRTRGVVSENIFSGFRFPNTIRTNKQRDMWSEKELRSTCLDWMQIGG